MNPCSFNLDSPQTFDSQALHRSLGLLIAKARVNSELSLEETAELLSISESSLQKYENGTAALPLDQLFGLVNLLNIAPEDVFATIHDCLAIRV